MKQLLLLSFICCFALSAAAQRLSPVQIDMDVLIPNRDGLKLSASVYLPANTSEKLPTLIALTPYGKDKLHKDAYWFAERGYGVVLADCRGRGTSEGVFTPFEHDGKDGFDICKWASKKEWCDGNIGMFGGSYLGKVQWLTLREHPPALKTIVPIASGAPGIDLPMLNNIFYTFSAQWLAFTSGRTTNTNIFVDHRYWNSIFLNMFKNHIPFNQLPDLAGFESTIFQKWIAHPSYGKYYKGINLNKLEYETSTTTALTITGYFDDNQRGSLYFHNNLIEHASKEIAEGSYVVIGPWGHSETRYPKASFHNLTFGQNSIVHIRKLMLEWFNWKLRRKSKPSFLTRNVVYYNMGVDSWKNAKSLQAVSDTVSRWYLQPVKSGENSLYNTGSLLKNLAGFDTPTRILFDPLDTTNASLKLTDGLIDLSWRDEKEALFPEKTVFQSEPLRKNVNLCGTIKFDAYISLNVPDADLEAILYEIRPDGSCIYLTSDIKRARYRKSNERGELVKRKDVEKYTFDTFHMTCREIPKGSRLRLVFGFLNSPYFQKNYHSGKEVHLEGEKQARRAELKLFSGKKYPSAIVLPVKENN